MKPFGASFNNTNADLGDVATSFAGINVNPNQQSQQQQQQQQQQPQQQQQGQNQSNPQNNVNTNQNPNGNPNPQGGNVQQWGFPPNTNTKTNTNTNSNPFGNVGSSFGASIGAATNNNNNNNSSALQNGTNSNTQQAAATTFAFTNNNNGNTNANQTGSSFIPSNNSNGSVTVVNGSNNTQTQQQSQAQAASLDSGITGWGTFATDEPSPPANSNTNNNNNNNGNNNNTNHSSTKPETNNNNNNNNTEEKEALSNYQYYQQNQNNQRLGGIEPNTQGTVSSNLGDAGGQYRHKDFLTFESMGVLRKELVDAVNKVGWKRPSYIQAAVLPVVLNSNDKQNYLRNVIGQAQHGSGKTGAFLLNVLQRIDLTKRKLQAMVICHSRELATQTKTEATKLAAYMGDLEIVLAVPPPKDNPSQRVPENKDWTAQVCIGTPGVVLFNVLGYNQYQNVSKYKLNDFLREFKILVVDEADEFLEEDMASSDNQQRPSGNLKTGFRHMGRVLYGRMNPKFANNNRGRGPSRGANRGRGGGAGGGKYEYYPRGYYLTMYEQLQEIANLFSKNAHQYQCLLFSATFPKEIVSLTGRLGCNNPYRVKVEKKELGLKNIKNIVIECEETTKFKILCEILIHFGLSQGIIFTNSVKQAQNVHQLLQKGTDDMAEVNCSLLVGTMPRDERDKHMESFRMNETRILIASNVIARGINVPQVNLVVNYEIPFVIKDKYVDRSKVDGETFMHRVGRTGRFGNRGVCVNFVEPKTGANHSRSLLQQVLQEYNLHGNVDWIDTRNYGNPNFHIEDEIEAKIGKWIEVGHVAKKQ